MLHAVVFAIAMFANLPLAQAQVRAVNTSPEVAIARSQLDEAQALFDQARATYGPALIANYALAPQGGALGQTISQRMTALGAQVTLGDVLAYAPLVAQANANLRAASFDYASARRTERTRVIGLYFDALSSHATLQAREQALASARAQQGAATLRYRAGDVPRLDVVRAAVAVAQAQAVVATASADEQNAYAALDVEANVQDAALSTLADVAPAPTQPMPDLAQAVRAALSRRPEIISAHADVAAEEQAVCALRGSGFPAITLSGGYTRGVDSGVVVAGPSAGVQLTFPVGGVAHDRVLAEQARLAQARARSEQVRRSVTTEVSSAVRRYDAQVLALAAARRALAEATAEVRATELGYRSGASSSLDVETARATYTQTLVDEIHAAYARAQAQATLQLLIGQ